jgi:hypothetical protein
MNKKDVPREVFHSALTSGEKKCSAPNYAALPAAVAIKAIVRSQRADLSRHGCDEQQVPMR